jgi:glutamine amidotransferase
MCRWLAYLGRPLFAEDLLYTPEHSLIDQGQAAREAKLPVNGDGFGIGWYGLRKEPGIYREVLPVWNDRNLRSLSRQIETRLLFAHIRASTGTATTRSNCHPFGADRWMFMHNGQIGGYMSVRRELESMLPDHLYSFREGATDSELIFLLTLAHGLEDSPEDAIAQTIARIEEVLESRGVEEPMKLTAAYTNGEKIYAVRYSSDRIAPTLYIKCEEDSVLVTSEPLDEQADHWRPVAPSGIVIVDGPDNCRIQRIELPCRGDRSRLAV